MKTSQINKYYYIDKYYHSVKLTGRFIVPHDYSAHERLVHRWTFVVFAIQGEL